MKYYKATTAVTMPDGGVIPTGSIIGEVTYNGLPTATKAFFVEDTESTIGSPASPKPTGVFGTGAGTGSGLSFNGDNYAGYISFVTGNTGGLPVANQIILTVTFNPVLPKRPRAIILSSGGPGGTVVIGKMYVGGIGTYDMTNELWYIVNANGVMPTFSSVQLFYNVIL